VWACGSGVPRWLAGLSVEKTERLLQARVENTVRGLAGRIDLWDVVNEAVNVRTWRHKIENLDDPNDWGVEDEIPAIADYVAPAFRWAFEANPAATLVLNEYNTIAVPAVRERFLALVAELHRLGSGDPGPRAPRALVPARGAAGHDRRAGRHRPSPAHHRAAPPVVRQGDHRRLA
jgi:GH35 family endo-1,4-beta-xylanase